MGGNLSPDQFGEPFHDPDEPFTYMPDKTGPKGRAIERFAPFDPFDEPDVDPMHRRVN